MVVRDASCSLLLFQAPESEGWAQLLAAGGLSVWQRSSRKHTANRRRARTDTVGAGAVGSVQQVGSRARADAALRLVEGEPFNGCALPARDAALSLCLGARWAAIKSDAPLNSATLPRNVDEASQVPKQSPLGSSSRRRYSGARFERLGNRLMRSSTPPCPHD